MSVDEIFQTMRDLVSEQFAMEPAEVTMDTSFEEDLGADSVDLVELVMAMEEEFDMGEANEDELAGLKTVGDAVNFVASKLKKKRVAPPCAGLPYEVNRDAGTGEKIKLYLPEPRTAAGGAESQLLRE